jgi:SAM-dependent methyltransferase
VRRELNIWEHSQGLLALNLARGLDEAPEMDSSAQGAELIAPLMAKSLCPKLLDAGCGGGHFYHSLARRGINVDYYGLDKSPQVAQTAREAFKTKGLDPQRILTGSMEDLCGLTFDLGVIINTLTFCADFREPLDRIINTGVRGLVIRDNFGPQTVIRWEEDGFLDEGFNHLCGYWNRWSTREVTEFLAKRAFETKIVLDQRTKGQMELVVNKPYYWSWLVAWK